MFANFFKDLIVSSFGTYIEVSIIQYTLMLKYMLFM
jgi:hypothetical protein